MFDPSSGASLDRLETQLLAHERVIAQHRSAQLELIRVLDRAQVATADGCRTMAEWVGGRLDLDPVTATTLVKTARWISSCDPLGAVLEDGAASFDRIAATARLRSVGADESLLETSTGFDLQNVRRLIARTAHRDDGRCIDTFESRHLVMQPSLDESVWRLWGLLPGYDGRIIEKALLERADSMPEEPDGPRSSRAARTADALTGICVDALSPSGRADEGISPLITLHVDAHRLADAKGHAGIAIEGGPAVGLSVLEEVLCAGRVELTATDLDGRALAAGRTTRVIKPRLRRYVLHRDGGCAADGCTSRYRLQPHHVVPWSEGGRTDPENLTTLCWFHHHVVIHGRGFAIDPDSPPQRRRFVRHHRRGPP